MISTLYGNGTFKKRDVDIHIIFTHFLDLFGSPFERIGYHHLHQFRQKESQPRMYPREKSRHSRPSIDLPQRHRGWAHQLRGCTHLIIITTRHLAAIRSDFHLSLLVFRPPPPPKKKMEMERARERGREAKYPHLWNLTRDKGIARPPTGSDGGG